MPPEEQIFTLSAAEFLSGATEMAESMDTVAESISVVLERVGALDAAAASLTAADSRIGEAAAAAAGEAGALSGAAEEAAANAAALDGAIAGLVLNEDDLAAASEAAVAELDGQRAAIADLVASSAALRADLDETATAIGAESDSLDAATVKIKAAGDANEETGASAAAMGSKAKMGALAIAAGLVYATVEASKFQSQVTRLYTAAGLTGVKMSVVSTDLLNLGDKVGYTGTEMAEAMYHPISAGLSFAAALKVVGDSAELARIHGADLADTTYALSSVMKAYNLQASQVGNTSALLNAIVGEGDMTFQDFIESVKNWAPTGASMGISIRSMGAAIAYLTDRGNSAEVASTRLTMGLSMVTSGSKAANTYLSALGVTSASVALKNKTLADVMNAAGLTTNRLAKDLKQPDGIYYALHDLQGAFRKSGLSAEQANQVMAKLFGGGRSDKAILSLMQNLDGLRAKYGQIGHAVGGFGNSVHKAYATAGIEAHRVWAGIQNLAIAFGKLLLPAVSDVLKYVNKFIAWMQKHPLVEKFAGALIAVALAAAAIAAVAGGAAAAIAAIVDPVALVVIGVIALIAGLAYLYKRFVVVREIVSDVGKFFAKAWQTAVKAAGAVIKWFTDGPLKWIEKETGKMVTWVMAQVKFLTDWWNAHWTEISEVASAAWSIIKTVITVAWGIIEPVLRVGLTVIKALWTVVWGAIRDTVVVVWHVVLDVISGAIHLVANIIGVVLDIITGHWSQAWHDIVHLVTQLWDDVVKTTEDLLGGLAHGIWDIGKNIIMGLIHGIESAAGALWDAIKAIAHGIESVFKGVMGIFSPSRKMYDLGSQVTRGLALGIRETAGQVYAESRKLGAQVAAALAAGYITSSEASSLDARIKDDTARDIRDIAARKAELAKRMKELALEMKRNLVGSLTSGTASQVNTAVKSLLSYVRDAFDAGAISYKRSSWLTSFLNADNNKLQLEANKRTRILAEIKAAKSYEKSLQQSLVSYGDLSNLSAVANATAANPVTSKGIVTDLRARLARIRRFGQLIRELARRGLDKALINQIVQAGPDAGIPEAEAFLQGPASEIAQANRAESQLNAAAAGMAKSTTNIMYEGGKNAGKGFLAGLKDQVAAITKVMQEIARKMVEVLKKELGIHSKSKVTQYHGLMAALGFAQGMTDGTPQVDAAARRMTAGLTGRHPLAVGGGQGGGAAVYNISVSVTVPGGYIGSEQQLAAHLYPVIQKVVLQVAHRNPGNGLVLSR